MSEKKYDIYVTGTVDGQSIFSDEEIEHKVIKGVNEEQAKAIEFLLNRGRGFAYAKIQITCDFCGKEEGYLCSVTRQPNHYKLCEDCHDNLPVF